VIISNSRKFRKPSRASTKSVKPFLYVVNSLLDIGPGIDLSMPSYVLQVTIIKGILEETSVSAINISAPQFFSMVEDYIKVSKQKPVLMVIVLKRLNY
jgi:hypothetical protein